MTSGEMLDALAAVGCPYLHRHKDGTWSANVELPAPEGCEAKISSGFSHPTHESALRALLARVNTTAFAIAPPPVILDKER